MTGSLVVKGMGLAKPFLGVSVYLSMQWEQKPVLFL